MDSSKAQETWFMLRCAGGVQNSEIVNHTMLRFRPIAPKPLSSGTVSGNLSVDNKNLLLTSKRSKRKYVRVRKNNGYKRKKNNIETDHNHHEDGLNKSTVTLQLLPEKPTTTTTRDHESLSWCSSNNNNDLGMMGSKVNDNRLDLTAALCLNFKGKDLIEGGVSDQSVEVSRRIVTAVESWVTVESVTHTCMDTTRGLGCTDVERMKINLENDTCPGFISDGFNRVSWVNEAYKKTVIDGAGNWVTSPEIEIMVWLVIKEKLPSLEYSMFTTKVRLQYTWQSEKYSKMVPCDVFRMDGGGFAWRLDVKAALSLGR